MNFWFWMDFHPKTLRSAWKWKPEIKRKGWPLQRGNHVWYVQFRWLNFGATIDNEW